MPNSIGFFTPVDFGNFSKKTKFQTLLQNTDNYFYLGGKKAQVLTEISKNHYEVQLESKSSSCLLTALKIASYCTVIIPLIMLVAKAICRSQIKFYIKNQSLASISPITTSSHNSSSKSTQTSTQSSVISKRTIELNEALKNWTDFELIEKLVISLIEKGTKLNKKSLDLALANPAAHCVIAKLIHHGAKVTDKSLDLALQNNASFFDVGLLLKNGAKVSDKSLDWALKNQSVHGTVELLLKNGAIVTAQSLDLALQNEACYGTIKLLLKNGAKVTARSVDLALQSNSCHGTVELLIQNGAKVTSKSYDLAILHKASTLTIQLILNQK